MVPDTKDHEGSPKKRNVLEYVVMCPCIHQKNKPSATQHLIHFPNSKKAQDKIADEGSKLQLLSVLKIYASTKQPDNQTPSLGMVAHKAHEMDKRWKAFFVPHLE